MSQLSLKRPGSPVVDLIPRKYRLVDATEIDPAEENSNANNPFKWEFYLQKGAVRVPPRMRIRAFFNDYDAQFMFYLCRYGDLRGKTTAEKNSKEHLSVIQMNTYEAQKLADELDTFLTSFETHPKVGEESKELISYFKGQEERACEALDKDVAKYFENPDLRISDNLLLRFGYNKITKRYTAYLFNVVPYARRLETWSGPCYYISMGSIGIIATYLRETLRELLGGAKDETLSILSSPKDIE